MPSLNKLFLIGNVGSDPELRFTPQGKPVTTFRIATNRSYTTPDGQRKDETEWHSIVVWNKLAEQCNQFLNKGRLVYVEGRLKTRSWDKDGQKHYRTEVIAARVSFLDRGNGGNNEQKVAPPNDNDEPDSIEPDDIPF